MWMPHRLCVPSVVKEQLHRRRCQDHLRKLVILFFQVCLPWNGAMQWKGYSPGSVSRVMPGTVPCFLFEAISSFEIYKGFGYVQTPNALARLPALACVQWVVYITHQPSRVHAVREFWNFFIARHAGRSSSVVTAVAAKVI